MIVIGCNIEKDLSISHIRSPKGVHCAFFKENGQTYKVLGEGTGEYEEIVVSPPGAIQGGFCYPNKHVERDGNED